MFSFNVLVTGYLRALERPLIVLALVVAVGAWSVWQLGNFRFDASSETLVVDGDPDLAAYERVSAEFGGDGFLLLTFSPHTGAALDPENLAILDRLLEDLAAIEGVAGTFSILDVPLLRSPPVPISELADGFKTLRSEDVDRALAAVELAESPLFRELLITEDASTSAIRIDLERPRAFIDAQAKRDRILAEIPAGGESTKALVAAEATFAQAREAFLTDRQQLIDTVRSVRDAYAEHAELYLGGVPMIAADMIRFVKRDLIIFGTTVLLLMMLALFAFFRRLRWVFLPVFSGALTNVVTAGILGFLDRPATVISSNFVSLLTIVSTSLSIHLIVQYRELRASRDQLSPIGLVKETMRTKFAPCFYTALTTMVAFGSLTVSRISAGRGLWVDDVSWHRGRVLRVVHLLPCRAGALPQGRQTH